jgi:hypothetical protein
MNSLKSKAAIRWGIGVVTVVLISSSMAVANSQAGVPSDAGFELNTLEDHRTLEDVPGDHDGVGGFKKFDRFQSDSSGDDGTYGLYVPSPNSDASNFSSMTLFIILRLHMTLSILSR